MPHGWPRGLHPWIASIFMFEKCPERPPSPLLPKGIFWCRSINLL
jgi:hypothetical protein